MNTHELPSTFTQHQKAQEIVDSPEYENARFFPVKIPENAVIDGSQSWKMETSDPSAANGWIIMKDESIITGGATAKYSKGVLLCRDGRSMALFSKRQHPDKGHTDREVALIKTLSRVGDTEFLPPFYLPSSGEEIIMMDLKEAGFKEGILNQTGAMDLIQQRMLFLQTLRSTFRLLYDLSKINKWVRDVVTGGKGVWYKECPNKDLVIYLTDLSQNGDINPLDPQRAVKMANPLFKENSSGETFMSKFGFVTQTSDSVAITDPAVNQVSVDGVLLSEFLTQLMKGTRSDNNDTRCFISYISAIGDVLSNRTVSRLDDEQNTSNPLTIQEVFSFIANPSYSPFTKEAEAKLAVRYGPDWREQLWKLQSHYKDES